MQRWPKAVTCAVWFGVAFFVLLIVLTSLPPSPEIEKQASRYFTSQEIQNGKSYFRQRIILMWAASLTQIAFYAWLVLSGSARRLALAVYYMVRGRWLWTVMLVAGFCLAVEALLWLPFSLARLEMSRSWGMTDRSILTWLRDFGVRFLVSIAMQLVVVAALYCLMRWLPRIWWAAAAVGGTILGFGYAFLMPIVVSPLFNTFTPLEQTSWAHMSERVNRLAERAGLKVDGVFVMDASSRSRHSNAYFTGFGSSQRIVLYDTLLSSHTRPNAASVSGWIGNAACDGLKPIAPLPAMLAQQTRGEHEIDIIIAHEIGHWRHHHIVTGISLAGLGALAGFFLLSRILRWVIGKKPFGLRAQSDPAGVPLLFLLFLLGSWLAMPIQNAVSRHFERQADWAALEWTETPEIFIEAEKRLARENLSNVTPNSIFVWYFATHPPVVDRIAAAARWRQIRR